MLRLRLAAVVLLTVLAGTSGLTACSDNGGGKGSEGTDEVSPPTQTPSTSELRKLSVRLAREAVRIGREDPRLATALTQEAAGLGHGPEVVAALDALKNPHLLMPLPVRADDGPYRLLSAGATGRIAAGAGARGAVTVWDTYTGKVLFRGRLPAPAAQLATAPGGQYVAAATAKGEIRIWDVSRRKEAAHFSRPPAGNQGLAFADTAGGLRFAFGSGAVVDVRDTRTWQARGPLVAGPAGSVRDLSVLWDAGFTDPLLVGLINGGALQRWRINEKQQLPGVRLTPVSRKPVPHTFGATSGMGMYVAVIADGRSRLIGVQTSNDGVAQLKEYFPGIPQDPMAGDGAAYDENGEETEGSVVPDEVIMTSATGADTYVGTTADRRQVATALRQEDATVATRLSLVGPPDVPVSALVAWSLDTYGATAAFGLDDGRVLLWTFSRRLYPATELRPEKDSVASELLRLCRAGTVLLDREEWRRHLPKMPYRPACPAALAQHNSVGDG